jgi:hypothetical protein
VRKKVREEASVKDEASTLDKKAIISHYWRGMAAPYATRLSNGPCINSTALKVCILNHGQLNLRIFCTAHQPCCIALEQKEKCLKKENRWVSRESTGVFQPIASVAYPKASLLTKSKAGLTLEPIILLGGIEVSFAHLELY